MVNGLDVEMSYVEAMLILKYYLVLFGPKTREAGEKVTCSLVPVLRARATVTSANGALETETPIAGELYPL